MTSAPGADPAAGRLLDDHDLSVRSRAYARSVVRGDAWPLADVDLSLVDWRTSTRAKRRNGHCTYGSDGRCTLAISQHVYDRAGFAACRETIRHELVHAWQHQHAGARAVETDEAPRVSSGDTTPDAMPIEPGHGPCFRAWVDPLALSGRCSSPYEQRPGDVAYVVACPDCGEWWGRHRLCTRVRQAARGRVGPGGFSYCVDCGTLLYLRSNGRYLDHGAHDDETIRTFAAGDHTLVPTTAVDRLDPEVRPPDGRRR